MFKGKNIAINFQKKLNFKISVIANINQALQI